MQIISTLRSILENPRVRSPLVLLVLAAYILLNYWEFEWLFLQVDRAMAQDFVYYHQAYLEAIEGGDPYHPFRIGVSFLNHPFVMSLVGLCDTIGGQGGAKFVWVGLSLLAWIGVVWWMLRLYRARGTTPRINGAPLQLSSPIYWTLFMFFGPVFHTLMVGQINMIAMIALLMLLILDLRGHQWWAGIFLALAFVLKTSPMVLAALYLVTGRWRVLIGALIGVVVFTGISIFQFGSEILMSWLDVLDRLGNVIRESRTNQSILALAFRQLNPLGWDGLRTTLPLVHKVGFLALLSYLLWWAHRLRLRGESARIWIFASALTLIIVSSPLVWQHHSVFLILPLTLMLSHEMPKLRWIALLCIFLIQGTKLFEFQVTGHAWTALLAHLLVLWTMFRELPRLAVERPGASGIGA